jgi:mRNA interferase MazF
MLSKKITGLPKNCVVNVPHLITIDRYFLANCIGSLPAGTMKRIDDGLRLVLSL